jgi:hypothetical protein
LAYLGRQPISGNFVKLDAITTSATATYNLLNGGVAYYPQSANNCIVSLNGVIQSPTSAYTISGSTIVFSDALTSSDTIDFILVLGDVLSIGTPSDATVGFSKVTSNLITGATAETSIADADTLLIYDDSATALRKMTKSNLFSGIANTPAFHARMSADQTISNNTLTKVNFNTEEFDTNSAYDSTTNYRFTVPSGQGGKYFIYTSIQGKMVDAASALQAVKVAIYKNGSQISINGTDPRNNNGYFFTAYSHITLSLVATDYIEIFGYIIGTSGTNTILNDSQNYTNSFGAFKLIGA